MFFFFQTKVSLCGRLSYSHQDYKLEKPCQQKIVSAVYWYDLIFNTYDIFTEIGLNTPKCWKKRKREGKTRIMVRVRSGRMLCLIGTVLHSLGSSKLKRSQAARHLARQRGGHTLKQPHPVADRWHVAACGSGVLFFHSGPSSLSCGATHHHQASRGVRLMMMDRPT